MQARRRILVVAGTGMGHVLPHLAIAQVLRDRGHTVWLYAGRSASGPAHRAGCRFRMGFSGLVERLNHCSRPEEAVALLERSALRTARELGELIRRERIQLVLANAMNVGGALAAERAGLPWASLATTPSLLHPATTGAVHALLDLRRVRKALGLSMSDLNSEAQAVSPRLHLLPWSKSFDAGSRPSSARHVGPLAWDDPHEVPPPWLDTLDRSRPLVLASVSTVFMESEQRRTLRTVRNIVEALAQLPVQAVVTIPHAEYRVRGPLPPHVRLEPFTPHAFLVPRARAVITHGGWGTLGRALQAGVPLLVVPAAYDQPVNAALCEEAGVGFALSPEELNPQRIGVLVTRLLASRGAPRRASRRIAREIAALGGVATAASMLLRLR